MKVCQNCKAIKQDGECSVYNRIPPHTFAERCRHFIIVDNYSPAPKPVTKYCKECDENNEGWCLRTDHPDFLYNFVKVGTDGECLTKSTMEDCR